MSDKSVLERQKKAFLKYFGKKPKDEDMFGTKLFNTSYQELENLAKEYRDWYTSTDNHTVENVPKKLLSPFQIHHNMSGENLSRAKLLSELTGINLDDATKRVMSVRALPISIKEVNGAMIYASTIYRGKTQVDTGTAFEHKITKFVNSINDSIKMVPGKTRNHSKFDKDIFIDGDYKLSVEISFQVTTNSVIERKSHLQIPSKMTVIMIFGGLGWIERINALERIAGESSGYADCFGPCSEELERLKQYLLRFKKS